MKKIVKTTGVKKPLFNKMTKALIESTCEWVETHAPVDLTMETYKNKMYSGGFYIDGIEVAPWKFKPNSKLLETDQGCIFVLNHVEHAVDSFNDSVAVVKEFFTKAYMTELVTDLTADGAESPFNLALFNCRKVNGKQFTGLLSVLTSKGRVELPWSVRYAAEKDVVLFSLSDAVFEQPTVSEVVVASTHMLEAIEREFKNSDTLDHIQTSIVGYSEREPSDYFDPHVLFTNITRTTHRIEGTATLADGGKSVDWWIVQHADKGTLGCTDNHETSKPVKGLASLHQLVVEGINADAASNQEAALASKVLDTIDSRIHPTEEATDEFVDVSEQAAKKASLKESLGLSSKESQYPAEDAADKLKTLTHETSLVLSRVSIVLGELMALVKQLPKQLPVTLLVSPGTIWAVPVKDMPLDLADLSRVSLSALEPSTHAQLVDWLTQGDGLQYIVNNETVSGPVVHVEYIDLAADFDDTAHELSSAVEGGVQTATTGLAPLGGYPAAEISVVEASKPRAVVAPVREHHASEEDS